MFILQIPCSHPLPFCDVSATGEAKCVSEKNKKCEGQNFECLSTGIFPDPINCRKYYNCYEDIEGGLKADTYECENLCVFDPNLDGNNLCRLTFNLHCVQVKCDETTKNVLMNYYWFRKGQFVACCRKGGKKPLVTRCPQGFIADLSTVPVECKLNCLGAGKFENRDDSTKYFECIFTGFRWQAIEKNCFRNYYFDKRQKQCVLGSTTKRRQFVYKSKICLSFIYHFSVDSPRM